MALKTRVWGAGKLLLLGGALLLTYVLFAAASMRVALRTREVIVPTLDGQDGQRCDRASGRAGLNLKVEEGAPASIRRCRPGRSSRRIRSPASAPAASAA